ncbi:hypothetical protein MNBD_GAMMA01-1062 [hydrothermal vent metagenome]|uniref:Uncharacterized protein n=1 Tax=hydrothermal vent metagenome TaxID=652676 RepID=A0A3B0VM20_9ZZZZ
MKNKRYLITMILLMVAVTASTQTTREIRMEVEDWSIIYPPNNEVSIIIHDVNNVGLDVNLVFWRGKLPTDQIVYDDRNGRLKVYYAITDFRNVQELLNTEKSLSYIYRPDNGFGESAYLTKF